MKRETYYRGVPGKKFGIWNDVAKKFQFGICEDTPMLAEARLYKCIGDNARKWRFQPKMLPDAEVARLSKAITLAEFVKRYVTHNTVIRLWIEAVEGHRMLIKDGSEIGMEWAILDGSGWQAVFKNWEVIGVTDIVCESCPEAVNIVIRTPDEVYGRMDNGLS